MFRGSTPCCDFQVRVSHLECVFYSFRFRGRLHCPKRSAAAVHSHLQCPPRGLPKGHVVIKFRESCTKNIGSRYATTKAYKMSVLKWGTCGFLAPCLCDLPREIGACSDLCKEKKENKTYTVQVQLGLGLGSGSEPVLLLAQSQIIRWTLWYSDVQPWGQSVLNFHLVQDVHLDDICLPLQVLTNFLTFFFFFLCAFSFD